MKAGTICCCSVHKQVLDKRGIAESQHANTNTARLTACEVGVYLKEISQLSKICPPPYPPIEEPLKFISSSYIEKCHSYLQSLPWKPH